MVVGDKTASNKNVWLKDASLGLGANDSIEPGSRRKQKKGSARPKTMAELADKHQLYMQAVQNPRKEVKNIDVIYRTLSSRLLHSIDRTLMHKYRHAVTLREDFCGTAILCAEWVRSSPLSGRRAYGVDIDPSVIGYANSHIISNLNDESLVQLVCGDVLEAGCHSKYELPPVDIIAAFNFALCYFHKRRDLISYLKHCYKNLNDFGLLFCDIFGGTESIQSQVSRRRQPSRRKRGQRE
ncbi:hypothetical protein LPJ78_005464 [Coemansia sp. RSA 989]|nr:hypothetical protein LPJ78_005464 [Coemansia sp. RSA 989]KAJ1869260.1 hypothetical protein LPJ55_005476 [Coemansia sp. RSA 990]